MEPAILILSWFASIVILGLIARIFAAIFSKESRELIKKHSTRHLIWIFLAIVSWFFLSEFPDYLVHKHRIESKKKFIELMQHDLTSDSRFANVAIDTNHLHFISVTGTVSSAEDKLVLQQLIHTNQIIHFALASEDTTVKTNFNR
jgi:hypothetical protein